MNVSNIQLLNFTLSCQTNAIIRQPVYKHIFINLHLSRANEQSLMPSPEKENLQKKLNADK